MPVGTYKQQLQYKGITMIRQEAIKHWNGALSLDVNLGSKVLE